MTNYSHHNAGTRATQERLGQPERREITGTDADGLSPAKMNGSEAFLALRADRETNSIQVIAVTASAMEDRKKMLAAGFDEMQTKSNHVSDFLNAVEQVLEGRG